MDYFRSALMVVVALAALVTAPARAAYSTATAPVGFSGSASQWFYRLAANEHWTSAQTVRTNTALNVGGRSVLLPASMRFAANAGQFAVAAVRVTPGALATTAVLSWLLPYGIEWIDGMWKKRTNPEPEGGFGVHYWEPAGAGCAGDVPSVIMIACGLTAQHNGGPWHGCRMVSDGESTQRWGCVYSPNGNFLEQWLTRKTCLQGTVWRGPLSGCVPVEQPEYRPTEELDWAPPASQPLPWPVADEIGDVVPLPVELPRINPDADPWPEPVSIPVGAPVPVPGTDPQAYDQPIIDVRPAPIQPDPWRVDVSPRTERGLDPDGVPEGVPSLPAEPVPEKPDVCETNPNAAMCKPLGSGDDGPPIPTRVVPLVITPVSGFGPSTAECPAPRSVTLAGGFALAMPFDLFCQFADGIRPVIVGLAWLSAVLSFLGLSRKE